MAEDFEATTMICMFHTSSSASAAVEDLLDLGLSESDIAVVGDAHIELTGTTPTSTLQAMRVPDGDLSMLLDGLRDGGTIVAVMAPELLSSRIDDIFQRRSAELVSDTVIETNAAHPVPASHFTKPEAFDTISHNRLDLDDSQPGEEPARRADEEPIDPIDPLNRVD